MSRDRFRQLRAEHGGREPGHGQQDELRGLVYTFRKVADTPVPAALAITGRM